MGFAAEDWFVLKRCWSVQQECCWVVEVPGSICMALQIVGVELEGCHCRIELGEALGCAVGAEVGQKLDCEAASLSKATDPCLGTCHNNSRCDSILDGCVACTHRSGDHASRILGRRSCYTD